LMEGHSEISVTLKNQGFKPLQLVVQAWTPIHIRAVEQGFLAQYFRFDELMTALKSDAGLPPARLKRRKYMSTALLLVDELGFEPMTRQEASLFFRLVTYRYGRGAILITTNKSVR